MRQTANYQLSQWDAEDRILRENFNRDNEKIDEAIDQANRMVRLLDVVTDSEAEQVDLDLTGFDPDDSQQCFGADQQLDLLLWGDKLRRS